MEVSSELWPLLLTWFIFNPSWIGNYIHYKLWDEIIYSFSNFYGCTIEFWEWISNFNPHVPGHVIVIHAGIKDKPC